MSTTHSSGLTTLFLAASLVPISGHSIHALPVEEGTPLSRAIFTDEAWTQFVKDMQGWLDDDRAPTFSSTFVPSGDTRVVDEQNGITHVRVPGTADFRALRLAGRTNRK